MEVSILVDGGNTHNFIQSRIVSSLQLPITNSTKFGVMVGNGETLTCEGMCVAVPIESQKRIFLVDFYVLLIQGAEVVLGVQWLQLLGPVLLDYQNLTMEFSWHNEKIHLKGEQNGSSQVSLNQLRKMHSRGVISSMFQITLIQQEAVITVFRCKGM